MLYCVPLYIYIYIYISNTWKYFGLHTTGLAGVAFQVCTTADATIYHLHCKRRQIKMAISYTAQDFRFKRGLRRSMK